MGRTHSSIPVAGRALLLAATALVAAAQDFSGTWRSEEMKLDLRQSGAGPYEGSIEFQGKTLPLSARVEQGVLKGSFLSDGHGFPFTARAEAGRLRFTTEGTDYVLEKEAAPAKSDPVAGALEAWDQGRFDEFVPLAGAALAAGGTLAFGLTHHHTLAGLHPATLTVTAAEIAFDPGDAKCTHRRVVAPIQNIMRIEAGVNQRGEHLLNLRLRDPGDPKRTLNFNFATGDSVAETSDFVSVVKSPPNAPARLGALAGVLARRSSR